MPPVTGATVTPFGRFRAARFRSKARCTFDSAWPGREVGSDVDDVLTVDAGDQGLRGRAIDGRYVADVDDRTAAAANRDRRDRREIDLIRLRVDHLDVFEADLRRKLRGERSAERRANCVGARADVDAERSRALAIELHFDLRRARIVRRRRVDRAGRRRERFKHRGGRFGRIAAPACSRPRRPAVECRPSCSSPGCRRLARRARVSPPALGTAPPIAPCFSSARASGRCAVVRSRRCSRSREDCLDTRRRARSRPKRRATRRSTRSTARIRVARRLQRRSGWIVQREEELAAVDAGNVLESNPAQRNHQQRDQQRRGRTTITVRRFARPHISARSTYHVRERSNQAVKSSTIFHGFQRDAATNAPPAPA